MRKNNMKELTALELESSGKVPDTKIYFIKLRNGSVYYRQRDIVKIHREEYPGQYRDVVDILSAAFVCNMDHKLHYVRIWFEGHVYIHADDIRNYIINRQGAIENRIALKTRGGRAYWTVEAAAAIKKLFGLKVYTNGTHEKRNCPKAIADKYAVNPKLRTVFRAWNAMVRGQQVVHDMADYFAEAVRLDNQFREWKAEQEEA